MLNVSAYVYVRSSNILGTERKYQKTALKNKKGPITLTYNNRIPMNVQVILNTLVQ